MTDPLSISVIIPTLNEARHIKFVLQYLLELDSGLELIVVDAGSTDQTAVESQDLSQVIFSAKGRGRQMNAGARIAKGDIFWFLHADCHPHPDAVAAMKQALENKDVVGGGFEYRLDHPGLRFRLAESLSNRKNRRLKWLFGDMGIFVRRDVFERMAGYREIPLMEDMDFSKRLKQFGEIVILPQRMNTSARRWTEEGYLFNSFRSWALQSAWALGVSPYTLARFYRFK